MSQQSSKPDGLLEPFQSDLPQSPESSRLSGAGAISEATRFWTHRCAAYASYFEKLAKCSNAIDLTRLQVTFWNDLQRDYLNEAAALTGTMTLTGLPAFARDATPLPWSFMGGPARSVRHVH